MAVSDEASLRALRKVFGLPSFRSGQLEAVAATLAGQDSLIILPTGGGKSVCFQLPCHLRPHGFTVVVCPLIALAKDQVSYASGCGVMTKDVLVRVSNSRTGGQMRRAGHLRRGRTFAYGHGMQRSRCRQSSKACQCPPPVPAQRHEHQRAQQPLRREDYGPLFFEALTRTQKMLPTKEETSCEVS